MDEDDRSRELPAGQATIKIVGPCKSGKSSLARSLRDLGFRARSCSQEHSAGPTTWHRIAPADLLVYLDVSLEAMRSREYRSDWSEDLLAQQHRRLAHALDHCDLYVATEDLDRQQVLARVVAFLQAAEANGDTEPADS